MSEGYKTTSLGEIPENWDVVMLRNVLSIKHGKNQHSIEKIDGKYPILGTGGIIGWTDKYLYDKPSVMIGRKGTIDKPQYMDTPFWTIDTLFYCEIEKNIVAKWMFYVFQQIQWKQYCEASGVPSLSSKTISSIQISLPPLPEQQKIATILTTVDDKLENIDEQISQYTQLKKGLMQQLLTKGIGHNEFVDSPLGMIPKGWKVVRFSNIFKYVKTYSFSRVDLKVCNNDDDIFYIHYGDIHATYDRIKLDLKKEKRIPALIESINVLDDDYLKNGDLIIADASEDYEGVAKCIEIEGITHEKVIGGLHTIVARDESNFTNKGYRGFIFQNSQILKNLKKIATGTSVYGISKGNLSKLNIPLPPLPEQQQIANILTSVDDKLELLQNQKSEYTNLKKGLMEQLLTGRVRVKV